MSQHLDDKTLMRAADESPFHERDLSMRQHLRECEPCVMTLRYLQAVRTALQRAMPDETGSPTPSLLERILHDVGAKGSSTASQPLQQQDGTEQEPR
jgi:hypothetical protein